MISSHPLQNFNRSGMVYIATYSPDEKFIWTGCTDGKVREWDVNTGQLVRVFSGPRGISWIDDISPEGEQVLIEYDLEYYRTAVQVNQCPENPRKTGVRALRRTHLFFEPL